MRSSSHRDATRTFDAEQQLQIAMPMGGIGAGCVCLNGHGGLQDFSIANAPDLTAVPDGHRQTHGAFTLLHIKGQSPVTRLVEGPLPPEKIYNQGLFSQGLRKVGHEGLPRFADGTFTGEYPFGHASLTHPDVPLDVTVTGYSPFIPLDDHHSSLPCAILEYTLTNTADRPIEAELSFHCWHLPQMLNPGRDHGTDRNTPLPGFGLHLHNTAHANDPGRGGVAFGTVGHEPRIKAMWFRSQWFDWMNTLWDEVSAGRFTENNGVDAHTQDGLNGGSILVPLTIAPGATETVPVVFAWHFPNPTLNIGEAARGCGDDCACHTPTDDETDDPPPAPPWRPYYAAHWDDAAEVASYVRDHYDTLRSGTRAFRDALAATTVPASVIDAVSATLGVLKSPTVLRQDNGNIWAWEGCFVDAGCCYGSCTHVWNYAQAMPHLFPPLERTLREQELARSMDELGHINFRAALPDGPTPHDGHPAADGQLGGIIKLHRDWQVSGDTDWMQRLLPLAKRSLDYCIQRWDPHRRGALFEPHHNTYDIEFWGPDGMCTTVYIGALCAMAEMCDATGQPGAAADYRALAQRGSAYLDEQLFNGSYYHQRVMWDGLNDQSFARRMAELTEPISDVDRVQREEGPRYQYGSGCLSDGVIGAWMAELYRIDTPLNADHVASTLDAIVTHNWHDDLFEHACPQRPGYAMGHEPGLVLCSWPDGGRPKLPFVYCDEVWTGIEYQVAAHLVMHGRVDAGLRIVAGVRARHDGQTRNPFNEYECGNYYARCMASYAVLIALSGFHYNAVTRSLSLDPRLPGRPFTTFFSTATGWGTVTLTEDELTVDLREGQLAIESLTVLGKPVTIDACVARAGQPLSMSLDA